MPFDIKLKIALAIGGKLLLLALIWVAFVYGRTQHPSSAAVLSHMAPTHQGDSHE